MAKSGGPGANQGAIQPKVTAGDVLFFKFDVLHRSLLNESVDRCRWTIQIRMVPFNDQYFREKAFKPRVVTR